MKTLPSPRWAAAVPLALALALLAGPAQAQDRRGTVEISPFIGGYFGGTFDSGTLAFYEGDAEMEAEVAYGGRLGFNLSRNFGLEFSYLQSDPKLTAKGSGSIGSVSRDLGKMKIRLYELNMLVPFGPYAGGRVQPYFVMGGGVNTFQPDVGVGYTSTDSRFTANMGFGLKLWVDPHFGFRFEGKGRTTYINSDGNDSCGHHDNYYYSCNDSQWLWAGEATGGIVIAF